MDYETYRKKYFTDPMPQPCFGFAGLHGLTLFFVDYAPALDFYTRVLGPASYVEGEYTHGWQIGDTWLTLLKGQAGNPQNVEIMLVMQTRSDVERLQAAFIAAGGVGDAPADQLMYTPVYSCSVQDPFGTNILIYCPGAV
jgi:hypothetical protein